MIAAPPPPSSPSRRFVVVKLGNLPAGAADAAFEERGEREREREREERRFRKSTGERERERERERPTDDLLNEINAADASDDGRERGRTMCLDRHRHRRRNCLKMTHVKRE